MDTIAATAVFMDTRACAIGCWQYIGADIVCCFDDNAAPGFLWTALYTIKRIRMLACFVNGDAVTDDELCANF